METEKILKHYLEFAANMFANFTEYQDIIINVVADNATISFENSEVYRDFVAEVSFQKPISIECQIMDAFEHRCDVTKYEV